MKENEYEKDKELSKDKGSNKGRSRNKGKNKRNKDSNIRDTKREPRETDMNKLPWYMPNEKIAKNYDYALEGMLGIPADLSDSDDAAEVMPSVMAIAFTNTPGDTSRDILDFSNPAQSPINLAAKNFYVKLSSMNKKTTNYQPQDIALAILAENSLIAFFAQAVRLYGLGLQMNAKNRDIPRSLIKACGIDPDTFPIDVPNSGTGMTLTEFRDHINVLAQAANALPFVGGIAEFEKTWAMFVNYYCDDPVDMAQYYVPYANRFIYYDEQATSETDPTLIKSGKYEALGTANSPISIVSFVNKLKKCIDALTTSSLMNYVYPDIINYMVSEGAQPFTFPLLSDMYVSRPVYNETFLNQVHNIVIPGVPTFGDITQDPTKNIIETHISWSADTDMPMIANYVDFLFSDNPSLEDKIDALMFKVAARGLSGSSYPKSVNYHACADWVPNYITILGCGQVIANLAFNAIYADASLTESIISEFSKFKAAPILYTFNSTTKKFINTVGDLSTFGIMRYKDIKLVFDQAVLGLFTYDAKRTLE